jgi:hypothetical protein
VASSVVRAARPQCARVEPCVAACDAIGLKSSQLEAHASKCARETGVDPIITIAPVMIDLDESSDVARLIVAAALKRDPGPMVIAPIDSLHVYVGEDVVVKVIDTTRRSRLEREVSLAPHLPVGLMPALLASGIYRLGARDIRYACYRRMPGRSPGMGMPGVDATTARLLAEQAVRRLEELHHWIPSKAAAETLNEPLDHGGFVSQVALIATIERLTALDREQTILASSSED